MAKVITLSTYKQAQRRKYLDKYGKVIDSYVSAYVHSNLKTTFHTIATAYQSSLRADLAQGWDYVDLREILSEALGEPMSHDLYNELVKQRWFDKRFVRPEDLAERCVTAFIFADASSD